MNSAPSNAATKRRGWKTWTNPASEVPTSTGATAAGRVRGRAAISQIRKPLIVAFRSARVAGSGRPLRAARELRIVGPALLQVGVAPLLGLFAHVEERVGTVAQPLDAGHAVLVGVEAGLEHAQGKRREREHLPAPFDGRLLQVIAGDHRVDQ